MSRVVDAVLRLRDQFTGPLGKSIGLLTEASKAGDRARRSIEKAGSGIQKVGGSLTKTVTAPTLAVGTAAVKIASDFEAGMSQVQATMGITKDAVSSLNGQSVNTMDALGSLAKQMGASTKYSATEAAAAINNMAMAGYDVQTIYDRLPTVLSLASAGGMDLDYATQLVANGMAVMGDNCQSAQEMADKLAVTASSAYGSVSDFGEGLLVAGGQASLCGLSLTDTYTALGILGDNGIAASEGGTALRNALKNIYTPTDSAAKALKKLGVNTKDTQGNLLPVQDVLQQLQGKMDGLSEASKTDMMSKIFDTRTIAAANALIQNSGGRWDELSAKIENAGNLYDGQGAAAGMAAAQLDNLQGQITILKSAFEGVSIQLGEILLPYVKDGVDFIQKMVDKFASLSPETQKQVVKFALMAAAAGPVITVFGKMVSGSAKFLGAVSKIGKVGGVVKAAFMAISAPTGLVIVALLAIVAVIAVVVTHIDEIKAAWSKLGMGEAIEGLKEACSGFMTALEPILKFIVDVFVAGVVGAFKGMGPGIEMAIQTITLIIDGVKKVLEGITTFLTGVFTLDWNTAWDGIGQIVVGVIETITGLFTGFIDKIVTVGGAIGGAFSGIAKAIGGRIKEKKLPGNAAGDPYWRGGITRVNENGGEILDLPTGTRIIPHDASMNTPTGESVNIAKIADTLIVREEADIDRIGEAVVRKIQSAKGRRGGYSFSGNMA